jgi:phosphoribosylaminoimidazolecarboxamide formyltransferase / IMP cyclohydrolase
VSDPTRRPVRRALVSVYDKTGLEDLARGLALAGVEIVSTGSTAATIASAGVPVTAVGDVTGFPETLDGRVKTLHPHIHGGLLADLRKDSHREQLEDLGILAFELVVVNLYPFEQTVASGAGVDDCVEQIDIGGPAMVRASAKNYANVAIVTSPSRYGDVLDAVAAGGFTLERRAALAVEAFSHTATYDIAVASWLGSVVAPDPEGDGFPAWMGAAWRRGDVLRYGENPHQRAAVYLSAHHEPALAGAQQLQGKEMSYNNYVDADAARRAAFDHLEPAVAIIKHANPCGIAVGLDVAEAYRRAFATDPVSAFGGVVAANREVTAEMAEAMADVFTEVVVAPSYEPGALEVFAAKKNLRVLRVSGPHMGQHIETRSISGGVLVQVADAIDAAGDDPGTWQLVSGAPADAATLRDLEFAWRACRSVKSNAILLANSGAAVGVGMGQVNRVDSARLSVERAGDRAAGSVAASDAFFPFADGLQVLLDAGVRAVVQPGGSVRDEEVFEAARSAGVTMYVTGTRHFFH